MAVNLGATVGSQFRESLRPVAKITNQQLARLFLDAAVEAEDMVLVLAESSSFGSQTRQVQLRQVARNMRSISEQLWGTTDEAIRQGIFASADLAATQHMDLDAQMGMPVSGIAGYADNMYVLSGQAAQAVIARENFGHTLSQRTYLNNRATVDRVGGIVSRSLAQGDSARTMASKVRGFISPDTPGGASYAANRLARTEINNAYHDVRVQHMKERPWIDMVKWNLSGSHPRADQCDVLAQRSPYPVRETPSKPHPQCFCFVTPELPDQEQFLRNLQQGRYDDWLDKQGVVC
jgi:hypothetical protein